MKIRKLLPIKQMQYTIRADELAEMVLEYQVPDGFHDPSSPFSERRVAIENPLGRNVVHECFFDGMHIVYEDMKLVRPMAIELETDYETVEMHFELYGRASRRIGRTNQTDFSANSHNLLYTPAGKVRHPDCLLSRELEVHIAVPRFRRFAEGMGSALLDGFLTAIARQEPAQLSPHNLPLTPAMMQTVNAMLHGDRQGIHKRLFLEAKTIELLLMQLEQMQAHLCGPSCPGVRPDLAERMHHAKDIALQNLRRPLSLPDLARKVGTNEFALKKGFREIFGTTVFGLLAEVRMERARDLLLSGRMNVSEISDRLGYSNVANFSTAFKKRFGMPPTRWGK